MDNIEFPVTLPFEFEDFDYLMENGPPPGTEAVVDEQSITLFKPGEARAPDGMKAVLVTGGHGSEVQFHDMSIQPAKNKPDLMFEPAIDKQGEHRKETRVQTKFSPNVKLGRGVRPRGFALGRVVK